MCHIVKACVIHNTKRMLNCARQQNSYIPLIKNRFEPISNYQGITI